MRQLLAASDDGAAAGRAIAILVLVGLPAYLWGRSRKRNRRPPD